MFVFAIKLAIFDNVFVGPIPIDIGIPVHCKTFFLNFTAYFSFSSIPFKFINASSIEYISISGDSFINIDITLFDMSPYNEKFVENIFILFFSINFLFLKMGSPILNPNFFDSLLLAIMHPSLLDNTKTGSFFIDGLNTLSHET